MRNALAVVWLAIVIAAVAWLALMARTGYPIQTDLLALLPREERDPVMQQANESVSRSIGRRIFLAFGNNDRNSAREAAQQAIAAIERTGQVDLLDSAALQDIGRKMATFYFPYGGAGSVLSSADRATLENGRAGDIADRAVAQAFGFASPVDARLLSADPFLLLPSFLASLPAPLGRLTLDDGLLTVVDGAMTWVFVPITLRHEAFDLQVEQELVGAIDGAVERITRATPDLRVLRVGAIFFANHGAHTAIEEASWLTIISIVGTIVLIVGVFHRLAPLLLNLLAVATGIAMAFAGTFLLFGGIHVAALLFGTSLIGVVVDYGLLYSTMAFAISPSKGPQRLAFVLPSITLGLATTLMGYAALAFAPFPGLKQIAAFAVIGLLSSFTTVVLWFPLLDRLAPLKHGVRLLRLATLPWLFWSAERHRMGRWIAVIGCFALLAVGFAFYHTDDDVRRLQALSPALVGEQLEIRRLIGASVEPQYLLVSAKDDEAALQQEEAIVPVLDRLVADQAIAGYEMPATFVPSLKRQLMDEALVENRLSGPLLAQHRARLGLALAPAVAAGGAARLTVDGVVAARAVPLLPDLIVAPGVHIVALQGLTRPALVQAAFAGQPLVRFVDPTAEFSRLLGAYRGRAVGLTIISLGLVAGLLAWRYGVSGAVWTVLPPAVAALLVPAVVSLTGQPFTFFHAMGLVLVIGIGADYTIFCAEIREGYQSVTMLSILLAAALTLLSFGLLAFSGTLAVQSFGVTMLIGVTAAYLLAPIAWRSVAQRKRLPQ
jgi:predicted exporter